MSATDLTLVELEAKVVRELREQVNGANFPTALVNDKLNEVYEEVFNQPNKQVKIRKSDYNFTVIADTTLNGALAVGALSIVLADSSKLPLTGTILIDNEFIPYTANNLTTTLTCAAGAVSVEHKDSATVRPCYALPATIDKEKGQSLNVDGISYDFISVEDMLDMSEMHSCKVAIFNGYLVLPESSTSALAAFNFTPKLVEMSDPAHTPSLIPNNFRVPLLVNGAVGKLMIGDGQSGSDAYYRPPLNQNDKGGGMFFDALRKFYAIYGRQTDTSNKKRSSSIYD